MGQTLVIPGRDLLAFGQQIIDPAHLRQTESRTQFVQAVVIPEAGMTKPAIEDITALISEGAKELCPLRLSSDNHTPCARSDLFVGIESKDSGIAQTPRFAPLVFGANRLTGVLDDR